MKMGEKNPLALGRKCVVLLNRSAERLLTTDFLAVRLSDKGEIILTPLILPKGTVTVNRMRTCKGQTAKVAVGRLAKPGVKYRVVWDELEEEATLKEMEQ